LQAQSTAIVQRHGKYFVKIGSELEHSFEKRGRGVP
jgi:hypothetical protein